MFSLWLITFPQPVTWLRFGLGLVVYFLYSRRHSLLNRTGG